VAARPLSSEPPLVSVIVATYNRAHMIEHALTSIANQTYRPIEAVVVDDGSTDDTDAVVTRFRETSDLPILYSKQENAGCAAARNAGVSLARGELIAFLDSDDRWIQTAAEVMVDMLLESGADFVYGPSIEVFRLRNREYVAEPPAPGRPDRFALEHFLRPGIRQGACMFSRRIFLEGNEMDVSLRHNEDSDFVQRVALRYRGAYVARPVVRCYHHGGNKSADRPRIYEALLQSTMEILDEFPDFARTLDARGDARVREVRVLLVEALIVAGRFDEAKALAAQIGRPLPVATRVAFGTRNSFPLRATRYGGWALRSAFRRVGAALSHAPRKRV
jgi:glycosyltransferase involved in cell wall biosynthesis